MATKKKLEGIEWSNMVGKTTLLRIDWKSFKNEYPKFGEDIIVIVSFRDGWMPLHAEFISDGPSWKEVRFRDPVLPAICFGSKHWKRLIAWGRPTIVKQKADDCPICKQLICTC